MIWKDLKFTNGAYSISDEGFVHSNARITYDGRHVKETILKPFKQNSGYLVVDLRLNGKKIKFLVHRLIYCGWYDIDINTELDIHHIDENKQNNVINNLALVTRKDNILEYYKQHKRIYTDDGKKRIREAVSNRQGKRVQRLTADGKVIAEYKNCQIASKETGIKACTISKAAKEYEKRKIKSWRYV